MAETTSGHTAFKQSHSIKTVTRLQGVGRGGANKQVTRSQAVTRLKGVVPATRRATANDRIMVTWWLGEAVDVTNDGPERKVCVTCNNRLRPSGRRRSRSSILVL